MNYNGVEYTLPVIAAASFIALFALEYLLLKKARRRWIKLLPLLYVVFLLCLAAHTLFSRTGGGGFIDLSGFIALVLVIYAAICAAALLLAWAVHKLAGRRGTAKGRTE